MTAPVVESPTEEVPSRGAVAVVNLLSDILTLLTDEESPESCELPCFCRVAVYPGGEVPWDSCETGGLCGACEGQLWGAIGSITLIDTGIGTGCEAYTFTAQIGATRCAAKPKGDGKPPDVAAVQNDAIKQAIDAEGIRWAIMCCPTRPQRIKDAAIVLESWLPLRSQGGCVGGEWTIRGRLDVCC